NLATEEKGLPKDLTFKSYEHGAEIAMYNAAKLLNIESIFDQCFKTRRIKGMSRSRILLLAIIHRIIDPGSKRAFTDWATKTSLPYHLQFNPEDVSSQAIWEAMDGITERQIRKAQEMLVKRVLEFFPTDLTNLHLDYTNYFTYIDSLNERCDICRRGHNKQKRDDLRQFSMALLTSFRLQIPLIWELYEGNKNDKKEFADFTAFASKTLPSYGIDPKEVVLTFDGGSNSEVNFAGLPFGFICAHSLTGFQDMYETDIDEYCEIVLRNGHKRKAYEIPDLTFSGVKGKGVLTYSKDLYEGQMAELNKDIQGFKDSCNEIISSLGTAHGKYALMLRRKEKITKRKSCWRKNTTASLKRNFKRKKPMASQPVADRKKQRKCLSGMKRRLPPNLFSPLL
ncbi:MAG: IS1634 family transposase, partial [Treponema sp.]|nr:IS1634 family transposase [Treponema sp.]